MDIKIDGAERLGREAREKGSEIKARAEDLLQRADELLSRAETSGGQVGKSVGRHKASAVKEATQLALEARRQAKALSGQTKAHTKQAKVLSEQATEAAEKVAEKVAQKVGEKTARGAEAARQAASVGTAVTFAGARKAEAAGGRVSRTARRTLWLRHLARPVALVLGAVVAYRRWGRKWAATWGTTPVERRAPMPGDDIVKAPQRVSTRAIDVQAPVGQVWPWLVQLGQGRAGLYSYDWLENLVGCDIRSSDKILPEYQQLSPGDRVRLVKPDFPVDLSFEVAEIDAEHALVLKTPGDHLEVVGQGFPYASWAFVVRPQGPGSTRLLIRWRSDFKDTASSRAWNGWGVEIPHFVMERKMLRGIKERAEREWQRSQGGGSTTSVSGGMS